MKEFSENLRQINLDVAAAARRNISQHGRKQDPSPDARSRALEFARHIPLPRKRRPKEVGGSSVEVGGKTGKGGTGQEGCKGVRGGGKSGRGGDGVTKASGELSELEALEALHDDMRRKVQASRSTFGVT